LTRHGRATLWAVIDCGLQTWWFQERPRTVREVRLCFELLDEKNRDLERVSIEQRYALSFWPQARLAQHVSAWLGRAPTKDEKELGWAFLADRIGRCARLEFFYKGNFRAIASMAPPAGPDCPPNRAPIALSLDADRFDVEAFHRLSDRLKDRVIASPTWHGLALADETAPWPAEHVREATLAEQLGDQIPW
jgi:hypothetical protein